jgi:hypothetical protein
MAEKSFGREAGQVIRVHVFVEGQTEETFIKELLYHDLLSRNIYLNPILICTNRPLGRDGKGGLVNYQKVRWQIKMKCKEDTTAFVTTMFDLFRLPTDFPGYIDSSKETDPLRQACYLEACMKKDINQENFFANVMVHEFESLLFSDPEKFKEIISDAKIVEKLAKIRSKSKSPEHINGGAQTAPSKRIIQLYPKYKKTVDGSTLAKAIGIKAMLEQCPHFKAWIDRIVGFGENASGIMEECFERTD